MSTRPSETTGDDQANAKFALQLSVEEQAMLLHAVYDCLQRTKGYAHQPNEKSKTEKKGLAKPLDFDNPLYLMDRFETLFQRFSSTSACLVPLLRIFCCLDMDSYHEVQRQGQYENYLRTICKQLETVSVDDLEEVVTTLIYLQTFKSFGRENETILLQFQGDIISLAIETAGDMVM